MHLLAFFITHNIYPETQTMAAPKVFVSSTCFDLVEIRDSLRLFIKSFGFEPILSEYGDVFYHPDLHTHEACVNEIGNCHLFVLVIGGRFGGRYVCDKTKSITNAEYEAAVTNKIPIFTYIKSGVLENHHIYQENNKQSFVNQIRYPALERQEDAPQIFEFINRVRRASVNNGYESFDVSKDIEEHLRKQWAGMFFEYLRTRAIKEQISVTNTLLSSLQNSSDKLEEITKRIYSSVDRESYNKDINLIEAEAKAREFANSWIAGFVSGGIVVEDESEKEAKLGIEPDGLAWYQYLVALGILVIAEESDDAIKLAVPDNHHHIGFGEGCIGLTVYKDKSNKYQRLAEDNYENGFKKLPDKKRREIINDRFVEMVW